MTDETATDDGTEYNRPDDGPARGHAAVGYVTGQRLPDGSRPEEVRIQYDRNGATHAAVVLRESGSVEATAVRFHTARRNEAGTTDAMYVDAVLGARPVDPDDDPECNLCGRPKSEHDDDETGFAACPDE